MKSTLYLLIMLFTSCEKEVIPTKTADNYKAQIHKVKQYAKKHNYNQNTAFMIDYSLHSGLPRFFVVNLKTDAFTDQGLVCHGDCKGDNTSSYAKVFSNENDTYCTSLGFASVGDRAYSKWGKNYKYWLNGLEKTNSNMKSRVVVLHAWSGVSDEIIYPNTTTTSWGCPTVSINFLDKLDVILKKEKKVLLYSFD